MTDAIADGGAPAPAEVTGAPIEANPASPPQALGSQVPADPKPATLDDAIERSVAKMEAKQRDPKDAPKAPEPKVEAKPTDKAPEAKVEAKPEQPRGEGGKFAPSEPKVEPKVEAPKADPNSPHREPPARFSNDAKAAWETAPEPVKAEVHRAIRELEQGYEKHKADSAAYNEIREFADMAKQHNTTVKAALTNYVGIEQLLARDPIAGLERVIANMNWKAPDGRQLTLHDLAAHILNQSPDEQSARQNSTIQQLNSKIAQLEQMVGGVTQTIQSQQERQTLDQVATFAAQHPRFDELTPDIEFFLRSGRTNDLSEAYQLAERLNPAPAASAPASPASVSPAPLNPAGQKSITGAPSAGSNPAPKKAGPPPSLDEAIDRAFARTG
jgi:hypothetical protein